MTEINPTDNTEGQPEEGTLAVQTGEQASAALAERGAIIAELEESYGQRETRRADIDGIIQQLASGLQAAKQAGERKLELIDRKYEIETQVALAEQRDEMQVYANELGRVATVFNLEE
ncbi:hypothetical protein F4X86_00455 [Candidatus Saccharibacteria bacterium]|nr:hypothetical protein [Candidatus Saccharibacteria bacterium]